jgi:hypothetical protein
MKPLVPVVVAAAAMVALAVFVSPVASRAGDDSAVGSSPDATIMLSKFQPASIVIGQPNFTSGFPNQAMDTPAADTDAGGLGGVGVGPTGAIYISDYENRRVLGFDAIPSSNDVSADFVLGQADFSSTVQDDGANQFGGPQSPVVFKNMLFVADFYNSRVMIWKKAPTTNQVPANIVLGQKKFGTRTQACGATGMSAPETLSVGGGKLVVTDSDNSRVLIYKKIPKKSGAKPDIVLGQKNLTTCVELNNGNGVPGAPSAANFSYPAGVWTDGTRLVVADEDESRVLIWKKFPKKNFQKADIVLGQPNFTSDVENNNGSGGSGSPSASNMNMPYDGVYSNGTQLFVTDQNNNRVMIWNTFPTASFTPADVVLGQPNFSCGADNNDGTGCTGGGPSANNLEQPDGVTQIGNQLIVVDGDSRYLIYDGE